MFAHVTRVELFAADISCDVLLDNTLSDGTFQAVVGDGGYGAPRSWPYVVSAGIASACWRRAWSKWLRLPVVANQCS